MRLKVRTRHLYFVFGLIALCFLGSGCGRKPDAKKAYEKGIHQMQERKFKEAIASLNKAISSNPRYSPAYIARGIAHKIEGEDEKAIADFNQAIELNPNQPEAYTNRGNVYADQNRFDLALKDHNRALKIKPDYANAYNNRASTYLRLNDYKKAWADVDKAKSLGQEVEPKIVAELNRLAPRK